MVKVIRSFGLVSILFFIYASIVYANGPATVYKVKLTRFELWNGTEWVTGFSGTSAILDIASAADTNTSVGNFLSGIIVPDGTYTKVRVTPSGTFTIQGNDGAGNYTTATVGPGSGSVPTVVAANAAECTITVAAAAQENNLSTSVVVKDGVPDHRVRVKFDTSAAVQNIGGELYPAAPVVTIEVL